MTDPWWVWAFYGATGIAIAWVIVSLIIDHRSPKMMLNKRDWKCTESHFELLPQLMGDGSTILLPHTVCDQWTRTGAAQIKPVDEHE